MKARRKEIFDRRAVQVYVPVPLLERLERQREKDYCSLSAVALKALARGVAQLEREPSMYEEQTAEVGGVR